MHPFPDLSDDVLDAIAARHGLRTEHFERLPSTGVVNAIWAMDTSFVLRVDADGGDPVGVGSSRM